MIVKFNQIHLVFVALVVRYLCVPLCVRLLVNKEASIHPINKKLL